MSYEKEFYQKNKYAIFCKTKEEASECQKIEKCLFIPTGYYPEGFYMCFDGQWDHDNWYIEHGYKIITAQEFLIGKKDYSYELY